MATLRAAPLLKLCSIVFLILAVSVHPTRSESDGCEEEVHDACIDKPKALRLKIVAIVSILVTSMIGVGLPIMARSVPALNPERNLFVVIKCFAAGIILGTGFMHVLPDSFEMLSSSCLDENPWHKFPFTGFVAMLSGMITLAVDALATSIFSRSSTAGVLPDSEADQEIGSSFGHYHPHGNGVKDSSSSSGSQLLRYRVVAMVLELGIIVHSVVIGLSLGATNNVCTIRGLVAALCFHQMFEGMGLGGCIVQAEYNKLKKLAMAFFFSVTTPFGIALGIALSNVYKENSPRALITEGLLNAASAGLLVYMALVDLLAAEFMGQKLQRSVKLLIKCFAAAVLGAGGMSILAKWA